METIIQAIEDGHLLIEIGPGCGRTGPRRFSYGPVGRVGPGGVVGEWQYVQPKAVTILFRIRDPEQENLIRAVSTVIGEDDVELFSERKSEQKVKLTLKPEHALNLKLHEREQKNKKIKYDYHKTCLKELGIDTSSLVFCKQAAPRSWYDIQTEGYSDHTFYIGCDEQGFIYRRLDAAGLIDRLIPEWYKQGRF